MGRTICAAVAADPDLVFVAGVDPGGAGESIAGVTVDEHLHAFADARCDVVVDFTVAGAARNTLPWLGMHGIHAVVGTTGFTADDFDLFESTFGAADGPNCVIAPELRHLRGADDAIRRDGGAVVRHRRDHRTPPRPQDRRPVGDCGEDGRAHGGGPRPRLRPRSHGTRGVSGRPRGSGAGWDPCALRPHARHGGAPGGDPRGDRPDA